ncbi:MAG: hypothetical protein D4R67_09500 [Bacteroidetes bacterium]|nr:MAG: hypothetical protein D4R67_09500 [Bacteroidota bacterium]
METNPAFDHYMDRYFDFLGQWETPSRCGLKVVRRKDGKTLVIATEIYRQNPGTPVTEWVAPLATQIMHHIVEQPENYIFIEHTPDLRSKLTFYGETFDLVEFDWDGGKFINPKWTRLSNEEVDQLMEE